MYFDTGVDLFDRCCTQVKQAWRGSTHQNDFAFELFDIDALIQHVDRRNVIKAALLAAIGNERVDVLVHRDTQRSYLEPLEAGVIFGPDPLRRVTRNQLLPAHDHAYDGKRQRLVVRTFEFREHGDAPDYAVGIRIENEVSRARCALLQFGQVGRIAGEIRKADVLARECSRRQNRRRQCTLAAAFALESRECIAEHDRPPLHVRGEDFIVFELRLELPDGGSESRNVFQLLLRQLLQHLDAGTLVPLGEHDVEADDRDLVVIEQLVHEQRKPVTRPGPPAFAAFLALGQTFLVDIENDDTRIDRARHRERETRVVEHGFEPIDERQTVLLGCMPKEQEDQYQSNANANYVFFQTASHTAGLRLLRGITRICNRHPAARSKLTTLVTTAPQTYVRRASVSPCGYHTSDNRAAPLRGKYAEYPATLAAHHTAAQPFLKKNSIFTPASSITSWSCSWCACASSALPFTTG